MVTESKLQKKIYAYSGIGYLDENISSDRFKETISRYGQFREIPKFSLGNYERHIIYNPSFEQLIMALLIDSLNTGLVIVSPSKSKNEEIAEDYMQKTGFRLVDPGELRLWIAETGLGMYPYFVRYGKNFVNILNKLILK